MPVNDLIQFRRGTDWSIDPVLSGGEPGFDTTNNILKIGDGVKTWSELTAINGTGTGSGTSVSVTGSSILDFINITGAGTAVVSLDGNFLVISGIDGFAFRGYEDVTTAKTVFNIDQTYNSGYLDVYYNGLKLLINEDYYANGGTTFELLESAASGDIVEWVGGYTGSSFFQDVGGSGTANYISKWKDKNTLTSGIIYDDGQKIGIGTNSPDTILHIVNPGTGLQSSDQEATIILSTESSGSYAGFLLRDFNNNNVASFQYGNSGAPAFTNEFVIASRQSNIPVVFYQGGYSEPNQRLALDTSGNAVFSNCNIGVNTTSPIYTFDVAGTGSFDELNINDAFTFPTADGTSGQFLTTEGNGNAIWNNLNIILDTTPQLGGNLDLNNNSITGVGNINTSGNIIANTGAYNALTVNSISVSVSGHTHTASDITNFNSIVSGLLPVKNISAGYDISISSVSGNYTIASTNLVHVDSKQPQGFINRTDSRISVSGNIFTIAPTGSSYSYYNQGIKVIKTSGDSLTIPNLTQINYIHFDTINNQLSNKTIGFDFTTDIPIAYIAWNSGVSPSGQMTFFAEERHGIVMDTSTHKWIHNTFGAQYVDGLSIGSYVLGGNGSSNSHATISIGNGLLYQEDIEINITDSSSTDPFCQELSPIAQIPVYYHEGSTGQWVKNTATDYPVKYGANGPQYNLLTGGTWTIPDVSPDGQTRYFAVWILATNQIDDPIISIMGQRIDSNQGSAENNNSWSDVNLTNLPLSEVKPLYRLIFAGDSDYTNVPKCSLLSILDIRVSVISTIAGVTQNDHGSLFGLGDDDHSQYVHIDNARTINAIHTFENGLTSNGLISSSSGNFTTLQVNGTPVPTGVGSAGHITYWNTTNSLSYDSNKLYWDSSNDYLGIGTSSPSAHLAVVGDALDTYAWIGDGINSQSSSLSVKSNKGSIGLYQLGGSYSGYTQLEVTIDSDTTQSFNIGTQSNNDIMFFVNATELVRFDSSTQRVGIGTSSPSYKLHVNGTAGFASTVYAPNIGAGTDNSVVVLNSDGLLKTDEIDARVWGSSLVDGAGTSNYISKWSDSNTLTSGIIYDDGTNVGIGTASPAEKLYVNGSIGNLGWRINEGAITTTGSGVGNGVAITLNAQFGTTLTTTFQYKVRLTTYGTATNTGATYLVHYNTSTSAWVLREVGLEGNTSNHPLLAESDGELIAYTNNVTGYGIRYLVESYNTADADSTPNSMGADYHWQRLSNNLYYIDGNVSIGTTTAINRLNVEGGNIVFNDLGGNYDFRVEGDTDQNLLFTDASADSVGIGTNAPAAPLHLVRPKNAIYGSVLIQDSTPMAQNVGGSIVFGGRYTSGNDDARFGQIAALKENSTDGNAKSVLSFSTNNGSAFDERMRILPSGNVAIGSTGADSHRFSVRGNINANNAIGIYSDTAYGSAATSGNIYNVYSRGQLNAYTLQNHYHFFTAVPALSNGATVNNELCYTATHTATGVVSQRGFYSTINGTSSWQLYMGGTARSYIEGNLGLGTSNPTNKLQVENGNVVFNDGGGNFDFRVEGDSDDSLFFVDASTDSIGIGLSSPISTLHIEKNGVASLRLQRSAAVGTAAVPVERSHIVFSNYNNAYDHIKLISWGRENNFLAGMLGVNISNSAGVSSEVLTIDNQSTADTFGLRTYNIPLVTTSGNVIFNETAGNFDFRVEGVSNPNLLFVDASADSVGIGTALPQATLDVNGTVRFNNLVRWEYPDKSLDSGIGTLGYLRTYDETGAYCGLGTSTSSFNIGTSGAINLRFIGQAVERARFDTNGNFIFNEDGNNCDFRIEGDTDQNLLFIDASNDTVNIGTGSSTGNKLVISSSNSRSYQYILASGGVAAENSLVRVSNTSNTATDSFAGLFLAPTRQSSAVTQGAIITAVATNASTYSPNLIFGMRNGGATYTEHMRISHAGNVGIGNNSPIYKLDVSGTGHFDVLNINNQYTFPTSDGSANQYLKTDGNGNVSWASATGGGSSLDGTMLSASSSGVIVGSSGWVYQSGQSVLSQGSFGEAIGDAQNSTYLLRTTSVDASWNTLLNNGQSGILLASNRTFQFGVNIVARRTDGHDNAAYKLEGLLYNDGYGCSIIGNPIKTVYGESDESWDVRAVIADSGDSNFLFIEGYGAASKIINWVAKVDLLEVGGNIDGYTKINILNVKSNTLP